ncbi:MAG: hypothetical protein ACRCV0_04900, partial [Brevinema sp.]
MRIYLLLIILLFGSCGYYKKYKELASPLSLYSTTNAITTNTVEVIETTPEPILVSYDKGLDLILVDTSFDDTISSILGKYLEGWEYEAIYWDSNN